MVNIFPIRTAGFFVFLGLSAIFLGIASPPQVVQARPQSAPVATVSLNVPAQLRIGQDFTFTATFANPSGQTGYGPIVDLILPTNGADGSGNTSSPLDGISFLNAKYLGAPVIALAQVFPGTGITQTSVTEPFTYDSTGQPLPVYGTPGDTLVSLQLPFGSFTPGQPPAPVTINAHLSNYADAGVPLTILARGGYEYGATALNDWCCGDATLMSPDTNDGSGWPSASTSATIMTASKSNNAPEGETATGPNFPRRYALSVNIAPGQTITNLLLIDALPTSVQYQGSLASTPAYITATEPITSAPQNPPTSTLQIAMSSISNTASAGFTFFVPISDANGSHVIDPSNGLCTTTRNPLDVSGMWTPLDPRDGPTVVTATLSPGNPLSDCSLVLQKSVTDVSSGSPAPFDTVQYTLNFQISDYFAFQNIDLQDFLPDGIHFDSTFTPTLTVISHGSGSSGNMNAANYPITDHWTGASLPTAPIDGKTEINFHVSDELFARGLSASVLGGCVPNGGTGGADPDCSADNGGATTGTLVFRGKIQTSYTDIYPGNRNVYLGDTLNNTATVSGTVLNNIDLSSTRNAVTNGSSASVRISSPALTKSVYAINGSICDPCTNPRVGPGDKVTYRVKYQLPSAFYSNQTFTDFLPLPIYDASTIVGPFDTAIASTVPSAGSAHFGPAETLFPVTGMTPTITTSGPSGSNSVTFAYGSFADTESRSLTTDILFTVLVKNDPFADGLFLTNQVQAVQDNHAAQVANAIVQVQLGEPLLTSTKSVIATSNPNAVYSPATVGPVTFNAPGTAGARWSGVINSTNLGTSPIHSTASGVDANDILSFALVIQNSGTSAKGAFDLVISDTLPTGFITPTNGTGLNLRISYGDATGPISYTLPSGAQASPDDLFGAGIKLTDPSSTQGVCQAHSISDGLNIVIITYDLQVAADIPPNTPLTNLGALVGYAGDPGGPNYLSAPQPMTTTVTTALPLLAKTIAATSLPYSPKTNVAVGELVTYSATITVPEGVTHNLVLTDTLTDGLVFITNTFASALSSGLAMSGSSMPTITPDGKTATFNLGDLTNGNYNAPISATLTLTYPVVVLNTAVNTRGLTQTNGLTMTYDGGSATTAAPDLTIVEPTLTISKAATPTIGDAGDTITYTLDVTHTGVSNANAYDAVVTDTLPAGTTYTAWALVSGVTPDSVVESSGVVTATWNTLTLTQGSQIQFLTTLDGTTQPAQTLTNTAALAWTSVPGDATTPQSTYAISSTERTGNASNPGGALNNYEATNSATLTTKTPIFAKSFVGTNQTFTADPQVAIGESITYSLAITIPEGTTSSVVVTDTLDQGLAFAQCNSITPSPALTTTLDFATACAAPTVGAYPLGDASALNQGRTITFTLGSITNSDRDNSTAETITVDYSVIALNSANNANGSTRANRATLTYDGGSASASTPLVTLVEPILALTKTASPKTADAGDMITYTLNITNSGLSNATAFDVVLTDTIPAGMTYVTSTVASGLAPDSFDSNGGVITATWNTFTRTQNSQFQFAVTLDPTTEPARTITNTANLAWTSLPGDVITAQSSYNTFSTERTGDIDNPGGAVNVYHTASTTTITTNAPTISKTLVATSLSNTNGVNVAIGETITYSVVITVPEGVTNNGVVTDTLPAGLAILTNTVSSTLASALSLTGAVTPTIANSGGTAVFNLGTITNTDVDNATPEVIRIDYPVVVLNAVGNTRNQTRVNSVRMTYSGGTLGPVIAPSVKIVEPTLSVTKTPNPAAGDAGDVITYTLAVTHTAASNADAFDAVLTDTVPSGMTFSGSLASTSGVAPDSLVESNGIITATWSTLTLGQGSQIQFAASLNTSVAPAQVITNRGYLAWTSLPGDVTTPQSIYTASSAERTGNTSNPGGAMNTYITNSPTNVTVNNVAPNKYIVAASETSTPITTSVSIGEIVRYRLAARIPEGTSNNFVITDTLPSGMQFITDTTAMLAFVSNDAGITSSTISCANVSGNAADLSSLPSNQVVCALPGSAISPTSFNNGTDPVFSLGNLVNSDSDADAEYAVVEFNAVVMNVIGNQGANTLANSFQVAVGGALLTTSTPVTVTVAEPVMALVKTRTSAAPSDAGDTIVYTLAYSNTATGAGRAKAYDVVLTDTLNSNLSLVAVSAIAPAGAVVTDTSILGTGGVVSVLVDQIQPAVDLIGVKGVTLTITATVASGAANGQTIPNSANLTFTSLPGATGTPGNPTGSTPGAASTSTGERNGSGGLNDYAASSSTVNVTLAAPTINKLPPNPTQYTIGDVVTYNICVNLPEGVTRNLIVTDTLPLYLSYVPGSGQVLTDAASAQLCPLAYSAYNGTLTGASVISSTQNVALSFSADPQTVDDNDANNNTFVYQLKALVQNVSQNQDGQTRTNNANLTYTNPNTGSTASASSAPRNISIIEPVLTLGKTISGAPTPPDAGGWLTYSVSIAHAVGSHSPAYDVLFSDVLPAGLYNASVVGVSASGTSAPSATITGTVLGTSAFDLPLGALVTVTYQTQIDSIVTPNQTITNTGDVVWTSLPGANADKRMSGGGINDYETQSAAAFTTSGPSISKSIDSTSLTDTAGGNLTIGEVLTYSLAITLPEGTTPSLVVTDTLPAGLTYLAGSALTDTAGFDGSLSAMNTTTATNQVMFAFNSPLTVTGDNDPGNNTFRILFQARALNVIGNQSGTSLPNSAAMQVGSGAAIGTNTVAATVVEPALTLNKTIAVLPNPADAGGIVTFTIYITNSSAADTSPAYDTVYADALPSALAVNGVTTASTCGSVIGTSTASNTLNAQIDRVTPGCVATLTYSATLQSTINPNQTINNTGDVIWTSLPGVDANERANGGGVNDYAAQSTASFATTGPSIDKAIDATSLTDTTGSTVTIGEVITYSLAITLPEGTTPSLVVTDTLPAGLIYVAGSSTADTIGFNGALSAMSTTTATNQAVFSFSSPITVAGDNDPANNTFRILFQTRVRDVIGNQSGTLLPNGAAMQAGVTIANSSNVVATVLSPQLSLVKTITPASASPNDPVTITLMVTNTGTSPAYDVAAADALSNAQFASITESSTPSGFTYSATPSGGSTIVRYTGGTLDVGSSATFTFGATLANAVVRGTIIANTATITGTTLPGIDANERAITTTGGANLTATAPDLAVTKTDSRGTITPGATTVYTITVSNSGTRDATGVVLTDTLPANTVLVAAGGTYTNASGTLTWSPFGLAMGSNTTRLVTVTLNSSLPAGTSTLTNTARVVDDGTHGGDTTPGNNSVTDVDTITASPALSFQKSDGGATVTPGSPIVYTMTYTNSGNIGASGVTITDTVPTNTQYTGGGAWNCAPNNSAGSICTINIGVLAADSLAHTTTFTLTVNSTVPAGTTQISNTARISDDSGHSSSGSDTTPLTGLSPDLAITKSDSGATATPGSPIVYTITYTNSGNIGASGVTITETVPTNTQYTGGGAWNCAPNNSAGSICTINIGVLAADSLAHTTTFTLTVNSTVLAGTTQISNNARISDDSGHSSSGSDTTPLTGLSPDLAIAKSDGGATVTPGSPIVYTMTYTNSGNIGASGVTITETVPTNTQYTGGGAWSCAPTNNAGSVCTFNIGVLAADSLAHTTTFTLTVNSTVPAGTRFRTRQESATTVDTAVRAATQHR